MFKARLAQYGSYVAEVAAALDANSDIVFSPIEPILVPWPWFRGRVVIGGDAAHTSPPHLTQGAAMAAEDGLVLAREMLTGDGPVEARLLRYSQARYARSAFVYAFSYQWMLDEQSVRTPADLAAARTELAMNASTRIARQRPHPRQPRYLAFQCCKIFDRNSCARSLRGLPKKSAVGASSTISPLSMNTTRWATLRAKPISCVTTIMVMPSLASATMTSSTSLNHFRIERRGRLVEQHGDRVHGERTSDGDALLLAAGKLSGKFVGMHA